ncbi:hypothetical protein ACH5RR_017688 [Cinchona calisaya]|uniref:Cysteine-rich receptor-like protein kinase 10 n=1 Tax=Cinchona calisaya TaxID=153742 RepID=A0ABD2ZJB4_9GENT
MPNHQTSQFFEYYIINNLMIIMPTFKIIFRINLLFSCCILCLLVGFTNRVNSVNFISSYCENNTYSPNTTNSPYRTNLNFLLSTLSSNASRSNGFYNSTAVGRGNDPSNTIYGLFLCRGDVAIDVCVQCVDTARGTIIQQCPNQTAAIVWYDECLLRYSNQYIFNRADANRAFWLVNTQNITDTTRFNQILESLMNNITNRAANDRSGKKFAVEEADFSAFQRLYTLAQCTPDLSTVDCDSCLSNAVSFLPNCCLNKQGGRVVFPSCNIRYEVYRFYNVTSVAPPPGPPPNPSPPPPVPTTSSSTGKDGGSHRTIIAIVVPVVVSILLFLVASFLIIRRSRKRYDAVDVTDGSQILAPESLQYNFTSIQAATNNFSDDNKVGEGGFGKVYKGTLPNGEEIAVKRLSRGSMQGLEEFKNEIVVVANLQHKNLVRLLGFCIDGEEKLLIYEFVPNNSLDYFLFEPEKQHILDWSRRYKIIEGIARGLLYLHEDSRLKVIHRDLKASNILLDIDMNPKIADFGMARLFGPDQSAATTKIIAGTYGYMSPEYAMHGHFSTKSDVYSFGVLVLEIVTGKKNSSFYESDGAEDLLSYAWKQWRDGTPLALLAPIIGDSFVKNEFIRSIHIGLLCVQEDVDQRPNMASVVLMLSSRSVTMPTPNKPANFGRSRTESFPKEVNFDLSTSNSAPASINETSITELYPR